jgi:hypothetical protein
MGDLSSLPMLELALEWVLFCEVVAISHISSKRKGKYGYIKNAPKINIRRNKSTNDMN